MIDDEVYIQGLYAIVDSSQAALMPLDELAEKILQGGAKIIQLRMKKSPLDEVLDVAKKIVVLKSKYPFTFIINDHAELVKKLNADGVHLGQEDMKVSEARKIVGPDKIIGKSTHSLKEADNTLNEDVDYIALGAIYPTPAKGPGHPIVGLEMLVQVVEMSPVPVVAIGGINRSNIEKVLETGVAAIAMISGLTQTGDVTGETRFYVDCLN